MPPTTCIHPLLLAAAQGLPDAESAPSTMQHTWPERQLRPGDEPQADSLAALGPTRRARPRDREGVSPPLLAYPRAAEGVPAPPLRGRLHLHPPPWALPVRHGCRPLPKVR